eukprot:2225355-Amphidinium_carterae.1
MEMVSELSPTFNQRFLGIHGVHSDFGRYFSIVKSAAKQCALLGVQPWCTGVFGYWDVNSTE